MPGRYKPAETQIEKALLREAAILSMRNPSKQAHQAFYRHFWHEGEASGRFPTLFGASEAAYDDRGELVALHRPQEEDHLTYFLRTRMSRLFQVAVRQKP